MKLKKINSQNRRDFYGDYECEFCGHEKKNSSGYDDTNFHHNVIPNMKCEKCGKSTISENGTPEPRETKYPDWMQV